MNIQYKELALPVSKRFTNAIAELIAQQQIKGDSITINFRDPNYSVESGGFHPVEMRLEKHGDTWQFCYITDFLHVFDNTFNVWYLRS